MNAVTINYPNFTDLDLAFGSSDHRVELYLAPAVSLLPEPIANEVLLDSGPNDPALH